MSKVAIAKSPLVLGHNITGISLAACQTCIKIPELGIVFDAGYYSEDHVNYTHIFISHSHCDHVHALPEFILNSKTKLNIYVPQSSIKNINKMLNDIFTAHFKTEEFSVSYILIPVNDLHFTITIKEKIYIVEPFKCFHSVPTIGYGFSELKEPKMCYLVDTDERILYNKEIYKYPQIIIECTYLYETDEINAKKKKHMVWTKLKPFVEEYPDTQFILIHFSQNYKAYEIHNFFKKFKLHNIILFGLDGYKFQEPTSQILIPKSPSWTFQVYRYESKYMFRILELDLQIGAGLSIERFTSCLLITDTLLESSSNLYKMCLLKDRNLNVIMSSYCSKYIQPMVQSQMNSTKCVSDYKINWNLIISDIVHIINIKHDTIIIEIFNINEKTFYGISESRRKLKTEYLTLPQKEICELVKANPDVIETIIMHHVCYLVGIKIIYEHINEIIIKYNNIIIDIDSDERQEIMLSFVKKYNEKTFIFFVKNDYISTINYNYDNVKFIY